MVTSRALHAHAATGGVAANFVGRDLIVNHAAVVSGAPAVVTTLGSQKDPSELFIGRADQAGKLLDLLAPVPADAEPDTGVVVVSAVAGMGGIGKTALARHTGTVAARRGWFGGGVLFVDLRGYDLDNDHVQPAQVFAPMLRVLGVPGEQIPATLDEQATVYHQVLDQLAEQGRRVLAVFDNASSGKQVSDLLPRHPAHRALVTTRDTLTLPTVHRLDLDVLAIDEAVQLLTGILSRRRPGDTRSDREQNAAVQLVTMCGALPLAVEITASILADEPSMTITNLITELTDGSGVHRARHGERTLATVFDLSWQRLRAREPEAAGLLPLLTLNPGPDFHTDTAAALAGRTPAHVAPWLRTLRQASLLRHNDGRWAMHDMIRLHARDHLDDRHRDPAVRRLVEHYLQTTIAARDHLEALPSEPMPARFFGRQDALAWLDTEHANLTATVALALDTGHHDLTMDLATELSGYLSWRRHLTDWVSTSEHALTAAQHLGSPRILAVAWNNLGLALRNMRRFEEAITALQAAATIFRELGDHRDEGRALSNLGIALHQVRRFEEAITAFQAAAVIARELDDRHSEGRALNNLGIALRYVRRFEEAITAHQQDLAISRELGDRRGEGQALINLGNALRYVRRFEEAITAHQAAAVIARELDDRHSEGQALNGLGNALRYVRRFEEAITAHQAAAVIARELGDRHSEGIALANLANALRDSDRLDEAEDAKRKAVTAFSETGDMHSVERMTGRLDKMP